MIVCSLPGLPGGTWQITTCSTPTGATAGDVEVVDVEVVDVEVVDVEVVDVDVAMSHGPTVSS